MASVGSDHRCVSVKIRLSLRAKKKSVTRRVRYNWRVLESDIELQDRYQVAIRNRFHLLNDDAEEVGSSRYARFIEANNEAAKETLTPTSKRKKDCLFSADPRVIGARRVVEEATRHLDNNCPYIQAKESLSRAYDEVLAGDLARKVEQAETCCNNNQHSAGWMLVRETAGDRSSSPGQIDGESEEDRVNSWYRHFKNLFDNPPMVRDEDEEIELVFHDLPINDGAFTLDEYRGATQSLRVGKSCGEDGVYSEVLKWVNIDDLVLGICNRVLEHHELPDHLEHNPINKGL